MDKFVTHKGIAAPLRRSNVDTDQIVPAEYLKRVTRSGFGDGCFASWRKDPDFVLNNPGFTGTSVLVAGPDFGTGSSREHAVWALQDYGFKAVISSRFADIFKGNSGKGGLLAGEVSQDVIEKIWEKLEANPGTEVTVNLEDRTVTCEDIVAEFVIDDYVRWRLMEGLDDIGLTMKHVGTIDTFEKTRPTFKPKVQ
ncbi:MAG: 3-isopropylmalate dehydratase small subunit [Actinobacteria bacterium]|jgi:3-isopropylmalate/(R)-2-methylmalate dehydratase small subunit|nr:3-isopropylmalate dehydratase small subunit [Actinomycetota bacterium]